MELCCHVQPFRPLDFYFKVCDLAASFVSNYGYKSDTISSKYTDFIQTFIKFAEDDVIPTEAQFKSAIDQKEKQNQLLKVGPILTKSQGARLVIITPPMYLPDSLVDDIKNTINGDIVENDDWQ